MMDLFSRMSLFMMTALVVSTTAVFGATYKVDSAHSNVGFDIRHMISTVHGQFNEYTASFSFDPKTQVLSNVAATINTTSIDTHNQKRDDHLRSPEFFNVGAFPAITFKSNKVIQKGKNQYLVSGMITLLGVSKPIVLKAEYTGSAKNPWGQEVSGFSATGQINRQDFGMKWNKALDNGGLLVGNEIKLSLQVEAAKQ